MVGSNVKAETKCLIEKRDGIESEMDSIIARLCVAGGPGITGNLVDAEVRFKLKLKINLLFLMCDSCLFVGISSV